MLENQKTAEIQKINTRNKQTINDTLMVGQHIRNGSGRIFVITSLDSTQIGFKPLNADKGGTERTMVMARNIFVDLYYLKNYDQIHSISNVRREIMDARSTGADRFLL
jgi:hypothetical protein